MECILLAWLVSFSSMTQHRRRGRIPLPKGFWHSVTLFLGVLGVWLFMLTLLFIVLFDNFIFRLTHPFVSGWVKGPWGFVFIYGILSIPVFPIYNWMDQRLTDERRRKRQRMRQKSSD